MGKMSMKLIHAVLDAFKNKRSRPRAIIWLGTVLTALMLVVALGVAVTTTYWFCAAVCHYPQADAVSSYDNSTHTGVACIACHKQPGGDPVSFLLFKVEALLKMPPSIAGTVDMPINPMSTLAMDPVKQPSKYCTQCHRLDNRGGLGMRGEPSSSQGIIMDHWAHTDLDITCAACHNRVGHYEGGDWQPFGFDLTYTYGVRNEPLHDDFMRMDACFRCHRFEAYDGNDPLVSTPYPIGQYPGATGECAICHTPSFELVPDNHLEPRFVEDIHGPWYEREVARVAAFIDGPIPTYNELVGKYDPSIPGVTALDGVPSVRAINYCYTCHNTRFCDDCHGGIRMPHPEGYRLQPHLDDSANYPDSCAICHVASPVNNTPAAALEFVGTSAGDTCSACHHRALYNPGWDFNPDVNWEWIQHAEALEVISGDSCMECHEIRTCEACHVNFDRDELARWQQMGTP